MPKPKNISVVSDLKDKVEKAKSVVVTDYRGLTHKQSEELHRNLQKVGGQFVVVKNSLWRIAAKDTGYKLEPSELTGPSAILLAYEDELAPLKELAKLPGKDVLQTMLVSTMSRPIYDLLYTLNGNLNKLVYVLSQIKK